MFLRIFKSCGIAAVVAIVVGTFVISSIASPGRAFKFSGRSGPNWSSNREDNSNEAFKRITNEIRAEWAQWDAQLANLKAVSDKYQPGLTESSQSLNFDSDAMIAEGRAIAQESDLDKRQPQINAFRNKYNRDFTAMAQTAGINPLTLKEETAAVFNRPGSFDATVRNAKRRTSTVQSVQSAQEDTTEQILHPPFGTFAVYERNISATRRDTKTDPEKGILGVFGGGEGLDPVGSFMFVSQGFPVQPGTTRVHVAAHFDSLSYDLFQMVFLGYVDEQAIASLRVMDGSTEVCIDRRSLEHTTNIGSTLIGPHANGPSELSCDFTRADPEQSITYLAVAGVEGWAGGSGVFCMATVSVRATLSFFQINEYKH